MAVHKLRKRSKTLKTIKNPAKEKKGRKVGIPKKKGKA